MGQFAWLGCSRHQGCFWKLRDPLVAQSLSEPPKGRTDTLMFEYLVKMSSELLCTTKRKVPTYVNCFWWCANTAYLETSCVTLISWIILLFISRSPLGNPSENLWLSFTRVWPTQKDFMLSLHLETTAFIFGYTSSGTRRPVPSGYIIAKIYSCWQAHKAELNISKPWAWTKTLYWDCTMLATWLGMH